MAYLYGSGTLLYGTSGGLRISATAAWTPAALSPLAWYRMDSIQTLGSNVTGATDLSGNGRHATQTTVASQPTVSTCAGLNGAAAIACNNTGLIIPAYTLPTPCTIFMAGEISATPGGQYAWLYCSDSVYGVQSSRFGTYNADFAASGMPTIGTAPVSFVGLWYVDSMGVGGVRIRINGTTYVSTAGVVGALGVYGIGWRPGTPTQSVSCKVSEICSIPGTLAGSGLSNLSSYSQSLYNKTF